MKATLLISLLVLSSAVFAEFDPKNAVPVDAPYGIYKDGKTLVVKVIGFGVDGYKSEINMNYRNCIYLLPFNC